MRSVKAAAAAAMLVTTATVADGQVWTGPYLSGVAGASSAREPALRSVEFDTDLDGVFSDTVRTATGVDAFSPGFCSGIAATPLPANGCRSDDRGVEIAVRGGYDWQRGPFVVGAVGEVGTIDIAGGATAFSTTPAFYAFERDLRTVIGLRGRVGAALGRALLYGTAGTVTVRLDESFTSSNTVNTFTPSADADERVWGYQAGAGLEVRLGGPWSLTGEYLYTGLDDRDGSTVRAGGPAPPTNPFILVNASGTDLRRADSLRLHAVRAAVAYRF